MRHPRSLTAAVTTCAVLAGAGVYWWQQREAEDRAVCRTLQELDGHTYQTTVMDRIHRAGRNDGGRMGDITRSVDGTEIPGTISVDSGASDYLTSTCYDLGIPVDHIDS